MELEVVRKALLIIFKVGITDEVIDKLEQFTEMDKSGERLGRGRK